MEGIERLEEEFNEDLANLEADLENLDFIQRQNETDSEPDPEEEEIQETMAEALQWVLLSRFVGETGVRENARTEDEIADNINTTKKNEWDNLKATNLKAYKKLKQEAMKGIEPKFELLKAIEEGSKDEGFKSIYNIMSKTSAFGRSLKESDMMDIFTIPVGDYDTDGMPVLAATEVDLLLKSICY